MDTFEAVMIAEEGCLCGSTACYAEGCDSEEVQLEAWQHLIDTGLAYQLQGWFGRVAEQLIMEGKCSRPAPERKHERS